MMDCGAAQQHRLDTLFTQRTLMALSDNPRQFREDPMAALLRQCGRARDGHDDGMNYMSVPF